MKDYIKDRKIYIGIDDILIYPKLKEKQYDDLFLKGNWENPKNGEIIIVEWEDGNKEILRMSSDIATDEIIAWCYLNDIL